MLTFQVEQFGGLNVNDESEKLLGRSHQFTQNVGWLQKAPVECVRCENIDFDKNGILKRAGSTLESTAASLFATGEVVINAIQYMSAIGQSIAVIVTDLSIYVDQSGSFAQVNDSASSAYSHADSVSKCSFAVVDGHLFIGLDAANKIQVYKNGADLDPEMVAGNVYEDPYGSGTNTIDGTWSNGYYLLSSFQDRLIYSDGNTVVNYSNIPIATDGIWKKSTAGFYRASGRIISLNTFTPDYQDSIQETLYIFTDQGPQITNDLSQQIQTIKGGPVPINSASIIATKAWLMMLTNDRRIVAINRNIYIDIGRRFNKFNGASDIEKFNISSAGNVSFAFYNRMKEQVYFFVPSSSSSTNKDAFMIDMVLGEPKQGEPQDSYERRLRLSNWGINSPSTNDFYSSMVFRNNNVVGVTLDGELYTFLNGKNDMSSIPINAVYETLDFRAGLPSTRKLFKIMKLRGRFISNYNVDVTYNFDNVVTGEVFTTYGSDLYGNFKYGKVSTVSYSSPDITSVYGTFLYGAQTYATDFIAKGKDRINLKGETFSMKLANSKLNETFSFRSINIDYMVLNSEI